MTPITEPFGVRFKEWRAHRGIADERMARLLGIHPRAIARLDSTTQDTVETMQIARLIRELQQRASEPARVTRQQARALWEQQRLLEVARDA